MLDHAYGRPQRRARQLGMPVPVILGVRVRAQCAEAPGNRDDALDPRGGVHVHARVARVEQRLPVHGPARLGRERRLNGEPALDTRGVSKHQRRLERCGGDPRMERESRCARPEPPPVALRMNFLDGCVEPQRAGFDFLAQRVPRREAVFTRDGRLRVVQCQARRAAIASIDLPASEGRIAKRPSASRSRASAASSSDLACFFRLSRLGRAGSSGAA